MPKDSSSDISGDSGSNDPVINTSRPGPNNSDPGAGSDWEPKTGGTGSNSYTPYYARPMNNPPQEQSGNQGRVAPEGGFSGGGGGGVMI
jgi:hypothetical protein